MSNYCSKGHWENGMQFPCKQCEIEHLSEQVEKLTAALKLSRAALTDWLTTDLDEQQCYEALAAIDALGEVK